MAAHNPRRTTDWPTRLPRRSGGIRFARRSSNFQEAVRFYRELVGLPLFESFGESYGSNGAIFGLPSWNLTLEIVESVDPVTVDPHEQLCLYLPDRPARAGGDRPPASGRALNPWTSIRTGRRQVK